jgi:hypothetical protein
MGKWISITAGVFASGMAAAAPPPLLPTGPLPSAMADHYEAMKKTFHDLYDPETGIEKSAPLQSVTAQRTWSFACQTGGMYVPYSSSMTNIDYAYIELAYKVAVADKAMARLGYPYGYWGRTLSNYERANLFMIDRARTQRNVKFMLPMNSFGLLQTRLKEAGDAFQATVPGTNLVTIAREDGCGAGETEIKITTRPAGARVQLIPMFFFRLCKKEGLDANDPQRCLYWRDVPDSGAEMVSGGYAFVARWDKGPPRRGFLDATKIVGDEFVITR